jgi:hypothetical protein
MSYTLDSSQHVLESSVPLVSSSSSSSSNQPQSSSSLSSSSLFVANNLKKINSSDKPPKKDADLFAAEKENSKPLSTRTIFESHVSTTKSKEIEQSETIVINKIGELRVNKKDTLIENNDAKSVKYGELIVLGYNGCIGQTGSSGSGGGSGGVMSRALLKQNGGSLDTGRRRSKFVLKLRETPNGVKKHSQHILPPEQVDVSREYFKTT